MASSISSAVLPEPSRPAEFRGIPPEFGVPGITRNRGGIELHLRAMTRRYVCTLLKIWFERLLILDDLMAEKGPSQLSEGSRSDTGAIAQPT